MCGEEVSSLGEEKVGFDDRETLRAVLRAALEPVIKEIMWEEGLRPSEEDPDIWVAPDQGTKE